MSCDIAGASLCTLRGCTRRRWSTATRLSKAGWHLATSGRCFTAVASLRTFASISCKWQITGLHGQQCLTHGCEGKAVAPDHLHLRSSSVFAAPAHPCRPAFASCWTLARLSTDRTTLDHRHGALVAKQSLICQFTVCSFRTHSKIVQPGPKGHYMCRALSEALIKQLVKFPVDRPSPLVSTRAHAWHAGGAA